MKHILIFCGILLVCTALLLAPPARTGNALPEYAAQTGEPCSSCHISPSGGGPRGVRGQAWVASEKPGSVPDLAASLELLGIELLADPAYFTPSGEGIPPAESPVLKPALRGQTFKWLSEFDGN